VSSKGEAFFTINNGITNKYTILYFILKLVEHLDSRNKHWRSKVIFMLDNASYHKSKLMRGFLSRLNIPLMFLGPYHFKMAPIEIFFAYIKNRDLNPLKTRNVKE
jgi:transposase